MTRLWIPLVLLGYLIMACGEAGSNAAPQLPLAPAASIQPAPPAIDQPAMRAAPGAAASAAVPVATAPGASSAPVAEAAPAPGVPRPQLDAHTPWAQVPAECKGFEVVGLTQSPGGDVLPNLCAPFEGTYNNPYAIRCQAADPTYKTQWAGDQLCILPPPPELGVQLHVGPRSYDDPADYMAYQLAPGAEVNATYNLKAGNEQAHKYYRANYRMRDGSHHLIMILSDQDHMDGWDPQGEAGFSATELTGNPSVHGTQRPSDDRPEGTLEIAPENRGIAGSMRPHQQVSMNLHHMNRFDAPILREAWINLWYVPDEEATTPFAGMFLRGDPQDVMIAPGEHRVLHYASTVTDAVRVLALWGHRHVSTDRFSAWVERGSGEMLNVYESFDWHDAPVYQYDSVSQNPKPDVAGHVDGASSGLLELEPGDRLHFLCDVTNHQDVTLRFANELYTGEMCILWGNRVGAGDFSTPARVRDAAN